MTGLSEQAKELQMLRYRLFLTPGTGKIQKKRGKERGERLSMYLVHFIMAQTGKYLLLK